MDRDIQRILLSREQICALVQTLARRIDSDYWGKKLFLVGLLKGSVVFMADLMRALKTPCKIDFMTVSSYGAGVQSSGTPCIVQNLSSCVEGYDVLIVEDIVDTGVTLRYVLDYLQQKKAGSIKLCALLDKPSRRRAKISVDYTGMQIPDEFVVGYGMDYAGYYRNLPYVGVLKPAVYT
ncbi:MAG TPA: hypoxanthine phosphoribosyltransferase [Candidatus Scatovicinus merdipullorum]|nr:hypoxanthine phosphoribosyltransferase [Candidatus Scatovicinus merdipullorum]